MNAKNLFSKAMQAGFIILISVLDTTLIVARTTQTPTLKTASTASASPYIDFTQAAEQSVNAVVHVKTKTIRKQQGLAYPQDPFFDFFFGQPQMQAKPQPILSSGSGVIVSTDGYIVTNNHVVNQADEIEVVLNDKRSFTAQIIGRDPNTDIALIKIEAENLTAIPYGNSDELKIGEWVLAIGNPFNLTSTVTAGIVSAKARNINILSSDMKIEAFIQTDAAVNPGNSGGALVNTRGQLVGINTAIASQTGSYSGYSFAVPISIVAKVVSDLKQYGDVQRAVLGVSITDISGEFAKEKNIKQMEGAYVLGLSDTGAAKEAGIKEGDIIVEIDKNKVKSVAEVQEQIGRYSPGDKVSVGVMRDNKTKTFDIELKNKKGSTDLIKNSGIESLGAKFDLITDKQKASLRIPYGIQISKLTKGGKLARSGVPENFIILKINNKPIKSVEDIEAVLKLVENSLESENALFISGVFPNGRLAYYAVNLQD